MYSWHHRALRPAEAAAAKPHTFLAASDGDVGGRKKKKEKASVWLPDYMLHMALQPLLWTLADESSLLCLRTLPRLHWVYSGWCTFFFSSTAKPAIFCSFSMPSLLPASTTPTLTPAAHWSMPSLKCCVQSSPQLMLRVSCCTLVERKYPPFHVCEVFFFSLRLKSAFMICLLLRKHIQRAVLKCTFVTILESCEGS